MAECADCRTERSKRHRVLTNADSIAAELHKDPFSSAPALYTFNVPRYFATNLRAREYAKQKNVQLSWCYARDVPLHPEDRDLPQDKLDAKRFSWLRKHDQETSHLPSMTAVSVAQLVTPVFFFREVATAVFDTALVLSCLMPYQYCRTADQCGRSGCRY